MIKSGIISGRCRPLNDTEKAQRSYSVVDTPNSKEITIKEKATSSLTKTFQFDKVFGIKSKQLEVYRSVVEPLIGQVLGRKNHFTPISWPLDPHVNAY